MPQTAGRPPSRQYELDLVLRNNITTPEHPMGVYHPHAELHHIKKETKSSSFRKAARSIFMGTCLPLNTMQCSL